MAQACLRCLKLTMCAANFLCFICGIAVLGFGIYMTMSMKLAAISPSLASFNVAHVLIITGIIITCVSFLGFLGALKENRCLLLVFFMLLFFLMLAELTAACLLLLYEKEISKWLEKDLKEGLKKAKGKADNSTILSDWDMVQTKLECCGVSNASDWEGNVPRSCCPDSSCSKPTPNYHKTGCFDKLKQFFEENFLTTGITVIVLCIVEVLGMCFAMTLYCHISRTGLGYKL
ncbi:leukocyte surface antigen CD53-like [Periophthalmus magnuspinnatus]|uniref:leukocyte surface antigen CD53-like n=1 Tax=Periophthalmus magnuspinnatus TaxID=409849 RepID=UPI00145ACE48|nr:leukocyte surface antigen CD53-like [Periophthalmus magnuspinnatus]